MTEPIPPHPNVCKRIFLLSICIFFMTNIFAQVGISTTSITPDATSILELRSTTLGFLAPRMTTTQRDAITSPATGLLIYNTTTNQLNYYSGSAWQVISGGGQSQLNGTGFVKASGTTISYDNSTYLTSAITSFSKTDNYGITSSVTNPTTTPTHTIGVDTTLISSRLWRQKGIDSLSAIIATKGTGTVTSFSKTDNYGITSSVTNPTTTPNHTIGVDTTFISSRLWRQKGIDSLSAIIATKGTGTVTSFSKTDNYGITSSVTNSTTTPNHTIGIDTTLISSRLWRQKGIDSLGDIIATKGTGTVTSFSKTDNYGITSSITNSTTTPTHTIGVDTTLISSRLWRQKGIDSLGSIIATKGTGTVTSVTSATPDATVATTTTTPVITIVSAPKLTTARTIQGVSFDGTANINPVNGTGFVKASGTTLSYDNSTYLTTAVTSFSKTDNYGIASSITNSTTTPNHTIGIDTTLISSRLWRQKGIDSLSAIIATKGTGTVTSASIVSANGFAGTIATATTTPAITISTSVNGIAKGNGTALSAATSGIDYSAGTSALATGILKSTTTTGALTIAVAGDFPTLNQNTTGNAATVTTNANLTGDVTSVGNATTLATVNSNLGTFNSVTVNAKGLVTAATTTTTELTGKTNTDVNSTYPDNSTYWSNVTAANGFPVNGFLNGIRKGLNNSQRIQDQTNGSTYARAWIDGTTSWTAWAIYLDGNDFLSKGQMHIASGNNSVGVLTVGTDGQVLTADAASINGVKWGATTGTGNVVLATSPTLVSPTLGVASATSLGITGTGGNGFVSLATQSANPAAPAAGTVLFSNATSKLSWRGSANTFVKTFDGSAVTVDRIYTLPDAAGTIPVSATGNISLSALGNISFTGILPVANGGTNSTATPTAGGVAYGDGSAYQVSTAGTSGQVLSSNGTGAPTWKDSRTIVVLGSDVINNNGTANTIQDVTGLSFSVTAGVTYRFRALVYYTAAATTTGSRWSVNGPASPTFLTYTSSYTLTTTTQTTNYASAYDNPAASNASSNLINIAEVTGIIKPSANGTLIIRFASKIANSAITAKAGSTLEWW